MCSKQEFTERIAQGIAERKAEKEAREIEELERRAREHKYYVRGKGDKRGHKPYGAPFYQT